MFVFALTLHCRTLQVQIYGIIREINKKKHGKIRINFWYCKYLIDYERYRH